jgi:hypothetical protein
MAIPLIDCLPETSQPEFPDGSNFGGDGFSIAYGLK